MFGAGQECAAHGPTQASGTVLPYIWLVQRLVKRLSFANSARSSWRFARWYFYLLHSKMWQKKNINCEVDLFSTLSFSLCFLLASIVLDRLKLLFSAYTQRVKTGNCRWNTGCLSLTFFFFVLFNGNETVKWPMKHIHKLETPLVYLKPRNPSMKNNSVKFKHGG